MIELQNIYKKYGEQVLFEDLNAKMTTPITKIKGENGIGKSVLLKMIVGYSIPDKGKVIVDGMELRQKTDFIENAGVSIDAPQFMNDWTGEENLKYLQNIRKVCSDDDLNTLIQYFELNHDIKKKYKVYSLGMRQKMRLIQAVMDSPRYLILDEPFDALDMKAKEKLKSFLQQYIAENSERILLYTSHSDTDDDFANEIYGIEDYQLIKVI